MRYIPNSQADRQRMLADIGVDSMDQLFSGIPEKLRLRRFLDLPNALSEPELLEYFRKRASKNEIEPALFIGAGIYRHYIPIIIDALISRSEFYTAYTPYQAEIAQGTLQAIFEYQSLLSALTGMDVAKLFLRVIGYADCSAVTRNPQPLMLFGIKQIIWTHALLRAFIERRSYNFRF